MRIIAIETTGRYGSVAALEGLPSECKLLHEIVLGGEQRTAQSLAPALREMLTQIDWSPKSIKLVVVAIGPGSFTGLRIGVTTAKAFAYAAGAEVIGVNSLVAMAAQAPLMPGRLWTILDAQRQELFVARFEAHDSDTEPDDCVTTIVSRDEWLARLEPGDHVTGPPLRQLCSQLPTDVVAVPESLWQPLASVVGRVGWLAYQAGRRDDLWKLVPQYYRASAAEEKGALRDPR